MIEITGMDALLSKLDQTFKRLERDAGLAVSEAGEETKDEARARVHVETGKTRDSIEHTHTKEAGYSESVVSVGTPYSPFLEMRYPFLFPSFAVASVHLSDKLKKLL